MVTRMCKPNPGPVRFYKTKLIKRFGCANSTSMKRLCVSTNIYNVDVPLFSDRKDKSKKMLGRERKVIKEGFSRQRSFTATFSYGLYKDL